LCEQSHFQIPLAADLLEFCNIELSGTASGGTTFKCSLAKEHGESFDGDQ